MEKLQKRCLFRITKSAREKLERFIYQRYPHREWGTFFRFGFRRTEWGLAASFIGEERPKAGDLDRASSIVVFRSKYVLRAHHIVEDESVAAGVIHSHPEGCMVFASALDDDMDNYFGNELAHYGKGKPYISLIFARNKAGGFHFTGRVYDDGQWYPVTELLTAGDELCREAAESRHPPNNSGPGPNGGIVKFESPTARLETLLGRAASKRLSNAHVGIIGCSGTGSPAAHVLARAGVGNFVLVDPQNFAPSNLERLHGSRFQDAMAQPPPAKVGIVENLIREINPDATVTSISGNILDDAVLDKLLECDLLLGCTDTHHSRAALGDFAAHYLLPSIDVGVTMRAKNGKLAVQLIELCQYGPDLPCPFCLGKIDQKALNYELLSEDERRWRREAAEQAQAHGADRAQYWGGEPPAEMTVGYLTTLAGSMAAGYAENLLTGTAQMPHRRFQFDVGWPKLGVAPCEGSRNPECSCGKTTGYADQARADRSLSRPPHWPKPVINVLGSPNAKPD
jgi:hypothetical protein